MSCFMGLSIQSSLDLNTYQSALSQIQDFISQTNFNIVPHSSLMIISNRYQKFYLPKNSDYLHSNLQHFIVSEAHDQQFVEAVVQCLMILKQHLPHKIQIQMVSDLELIFNLKIKIQQQIPRRMASHLKTLYDRSRKTSLTEQQLHLLIYNLASDFHKDYKQKIRTLSLKILSEGKVQQKLWNTLSKQQIKIIDQIVNDPLYQKNGIEVLERIVRNNQYQVVGSNRKENQQPNSSFNTFVDDQQEVMQYDGPLDPMTALFQLKQSMNLSRVSWIIENIDCQKLSPKKLAKFDLKVKETAQKFLKDFYSETSINQMKNFGRILAEYEMRRSDIEWEGLIQQVVIKIEEKEKTRQKGKSRIKPTMKV